jgi:hypothetical protein
MPCACAGEERGVDAIRAAGENAELPAFLAAVEQEFPRVLKVVALHALAEDVFRRARRAIGGHDERNFTLLHNRRGNFDHAELPRPITEMQTRRERIRLQTRFVFEREKFSWRQ